MSFIQQKQQQKTYGRKTNLIIKFYIRLLSQSNFLRICWYVCKSLSMSSFHYPTKNRENFCLLCRSTFVSEHNGPKRCDRCARKHSYLRQIWNEINAFYTQKKGHKKHICLPFFHKILFKWKLFLLIPRRRI
jgi:hypothetical protein